MQSDGSWNLARAHLALEPMAGFDQGWAELVPEPQWPSSLLEAVRTDLGVLGLPRSIETLRRWQAEAPTQPEARDWLAALARVLQEPPAGPEPADVPTRHASRLGGARPREVLRPLGESEAPSEDNTDPRTQVVPGTAEAEEPPTRTFGRLPPPVPETTSPATQILNEAAILSEMPALGISPSPIAAAEDEEPATAAMVLPSVANPDPSIDDPTTSPPIPASVRPPAAEARVRALAATLQPLAEELVPLPPPRRARRFWARWREVAGDRGVRRDFVEALLDRVSERDELLAELIAEVQSADLESVRAHLQGLDEDFRAAPEPEPEARAGGALVGSSVRVDGLMED